MTGSRSYDDVADIGDLYDHVKVYVDRPDVPFYMDAARASGGPVLELGCGTGRVLIPTARAGVEITGLDRAGGMLTRCRAKLDAEPKEVRDRVTLVERDMRNFDLGRQFALATIPFRAMQHQVTVDEQLAVLGCVRRHLVPGGRLVFDVFNPDIRRLSTPDDGEHEDTPRTALPGGRSFRRTGRVARVDRIAQVSEVELAYYVTDASGREERRVQAFPMRWFFRWELEHLLARAGFRLLEVYGDFHGSPISGESPDIVMVAAI